MCKSLEREIVDWLRFKINKLKFVGEIEALNCLLIKLSVQEPFESLTNVLINVNMDRKNLQEHCICGLESTMIARLIPTMEIDYEV